MIRRWRWVVLASIVSMSLTPSWAFAAGSSGGYALAVIAGDGALSSPTSGPARSSALGGPLGVAVDGSGDLFVADAGADVVEELKPGAGGSYSLTVIAGSGKSGAPTPGPARSSALGGPEGIAVDALGDVFITDFNNNMIEELTPTSTGSYTLSVIAGDGNQGGPTPGPATSSRIADPVGVALDGSGDVFVADTYDSMVLELKPTSAGHYVLSVIAGTGQPGSTGVVGAPTPGPARSSALGHPAGIGVDGSGDVYVADFSNNLVEELMPSSGGSYTLSVIAGTGALGTSTPGPATSSAVADPFGLAVDGAGNVFVTARDTGRLEELTPDSGGGYALSVVAGDGIYGSPTAGPARYSALSNPSGLAVDGSGDVFVADQGNGLVLGLAPDSGDTNTFTTLSQTTITGRAVVGAVLTARPAMLAPAASSVSYRWLRNGTIISGATASAYRLVAADENATVSVRVTYSSPNYVPFAQTVRASARVAAGTLIERTKLTISGTRRIGYTLTAHPGTWSPSPSRVRYQWLLGGRIVTGAIGSTLKLTSADRGKTVNVRVTVSRAGYKTRSATTTYTAKVT